MALIDLFYSVGRYFIDVAHKYTWQVMQISHTKIDEKFVLLKQKKAGIEYWICVSVLRCFNVLKVSVLCTVHSHLSACHCILHVMRK